MLASNLLETGARKLEIHMDNKQTSLTIPEVKQKLTSDEPYKSQYKVIHKALEEHKDNSCDLDLSKGFLDRTQRH